MAHLFKAAGFSFSIAHCNFQLREDESLRDEAFVEDLATRMQVPFYKVRFDTMTILSKGGLGPALRTLARRSAIPVELELHTYSRLPEPIEAAVYYVVSEALTNAAKHSRASAVWVEVEAQDGGVRISIRDDGVGGAAPSRGSGLLGLKDRVEALGGTIALDSASGNGTALQVAIPGPG
jgi:signal transduction histidine kinase